MNLDKLATHAKAGEVEALHLVSMEGGSYVLHVLMDGTSHPVDNSHGTTLHVASVEEARKCLANVPEVPFFLVQTTPHEEMVGQDDNTTQVSHEPIPFRSSL